MKQCYYCGENLDEYEIKFNQGHSGERATCLKCQDKADDEVLQIQKGYNN